MRMEVLELFRKSVKQMGYTDSQIDQLDNESKVMDGREDDADRENNMDKDIEMMLSKVSPKDKECVEEFHQTMQKIITDAKIVEDIEKDDSSKSKDGIDSPFRGL